MEKINTEIQLEYYFYDGNIERGELKTVHGSKNKLSSVLALCSMMLFSQQNELDSIGVTREIEAIVLKAQQKKEKK